MRNYLKNQIAQLKEIEQRLQENHLQKEDLDRLYPEVRILSNQMVVAQDPTLTPTLLHFFQKKEDGFLRFCEELKPYEQQIRSWHINSQYPDYFCQITINQPEKDLQYIYQTKLGQVHIFESDPCVKRYQQDFLLEQRVNHKTTLTLLDFHGNQHRIMEQGKWKEDFQCRRFSLPRRTIWLYYNQGRPIYGYGHMPAILTCQEDLARCCAELERHQVGGDLEELKQQISLFDDTFLDCPKEYQKRFPRFLH